MTPSAAVFAYLFIHLGVVLVAASYFTVGSVLAPEITSRARLRFARRPWLPAVIGAGISVPWVVIALILLNMPAAGAKFAGAVLGCFWILFGLIGAAPIAQHFGARGTAGGDTAATVPWEQTLRGGLLIGLTWVLPLVGWLGVLPLTMATGIGCVVLGIAPERRAAMAAVAPPAPPPPAAA